MTIGQTCWRTNEPSCFWERKYVPTTFHIVARCISIANRSDPMGALRVVLTRPSTLCEVEFKFDVIIVNLHDVDPVRDDVAYCKDCDRIWWSCNP